MAHFEKIDIRSGRVLQVAPFPPGRYSTQILKIDFGPEPGVRKSLARLAPHDQGPELVGRIVPADLKFPPRRIGPHQPEVLTLEVHDADGHTVSIQPDREVPPGGRLH